MARVRLWHFAVLAKLLVVAALWQFKGRESPEAPSPSAPANPTSPHPIAWVRGAHQHTGYLTHVHEVLAHMGYTVVNYTDAEAANQPWDLLWSHTYPFRSLASLIGRLQPHQQVNHFPGTAFISNKVTLAESHLPSVPKAFRMPKDRQRLRDYASAHPSKMFVQKSNEHRGIRILPVEQLDLGGGGSFVQEFIDNPLLIDGRKFDIGVYVVLTSVQPLRVYMYGGDVLLRFCSAPYAPFNASMPDKYVVGDAYVPTWRVPPLMPHVKTRGLGMREALNTYLREEGLDPSGIWKQVETAIADVFYSKEEKMIQAAKKYKSSHHFFEMFRFDFIINEHLKAFLMEANMSPNLSSKHFAQNAPLYRRVVRSVLDVATFSLPALRTAKALGVNPYDVSLYDGTHDLVTSGRDVTKDYGAFADLAVYGDHCGSDDCGGCVELSCSLCRSCVGRGLLTQLRTALAEHRSRGSCVRVLPQPYGSVAAAVDTETPAGNADNALMAEWFRGKCLMDASFCV